MTSDSLGYFNFLFLKNSVEFGGFSLKSFHYVQR